MRDRVTFIHAADLRLDEPFSGLTAASDRIGKALAEATYEAFGRVIDTAIAREVGFVVIAGDAYNSRDKSLRAQLRFREQMTRLAEANIEAFVVQGNHDPASGWSAKLALPDNVTVFPADGWAAPKSCATARSSPRSTAAVSRTGDVMENLSLGYRREVNDPIAIGVLHTNVGGNADYETSRRPRSMTCARPAWSTGRSATSTSKRCSPRVHGSFRGQSAGPQSQRDGAARLFRGRDRLGPAPSPSSTWRPRPLRGRTSRSTQAPVTDIDGCSLVAHRRLREPAGLGRTVPLTSAVHDRRTQ